MKEECQISFEHITQLLIIPFLLSMLTVYDKFKIEKDTGNTAAGGALFQIQQGQCVFVG